jgi:hypothetical protein
MSRSNKEKMFKSKISSDDDNDIKLRAKYMKERQKKYNYKSQPLNKKTKHQLKFNNNSSSSSSSSSSSDDDDDKKVIKKEPIIDPNWNKYNSDKMNTWPKNPSQHFKLEHENRIETTKRTCNSSDIFEEYNVVAKIISNCTYCNQQIDENCLCSISKCLNFNNQYVITSIHQECKEKELQFEREVAASRLHVSEDLLTNYKDLGREEIDWILENHSIEVDLLTCYPHVECMNVEAIGNSTPTEASYVLTLPLQVAKNLPLINYPIQVHNSFFKHMCIWQIKTESQDYKSIIQKIIEVAKNAFPMLNINAASHEVFNESNVINLIVLIEGNEDISLPSFVCWTNTFISPGSLFYSKANFIDIIPIQNRDQPTDNTNISKAHQEFALTRWDNTFYNEDEDRPGINTLLIATRNALHESLTKGMGKTFIVSQVSDISVNQAFTKDDNFTWRVNSQKVYLNSQFPSYVVTNDCKQIFAVRYIGNSPIKQYIPIICNDVGNLNTNLIHRQFRFESLNSFVNYD